MKFTDYYLHTRQRADRAIIKEAWIEQALRNYEYEVVQSDGRIRRLAYIVEMKKYLRLVVLEDKETIHNAFFDRSFNPNETIRR